MKLVPFASLPCMDMIQIVDYYAKRWQRDWGKVNKAFESINPSMVWAEIDGRFSVALELERKKLLDLTK